MAGLVSGLATVLDLKCPAPPGPPSYGVLPPSPPPESLSEDRVSLISSVCVTVCFWPTFTANRRGQGSQRDAAAACSCRDGLDGRGRDLRRAVAVFPHCH